MTIGVMGVNKLKIKTFSEVVQTWKDVVYISKIPKNLIFFSLLDFYSYDYKIRGRVLEVTWGCMILIKGRLYQGLYHIEKITIKTPND